jgi:hypothetical protein
VRKFINLLFALAMIAWGGYLVVLQLGSARGFTLGFGVVGGAMLAFIGAAIIWEDFLA